ncbi:MAG: Divergent PAP2 family protein [Firmicutes bacterium ADurb.Bin193]|nr:MAG: Divergent PAP2 family protein [Firmicutes bacterium ADurb.Bin193]
MSYLDIATSNPIINVTVISWFTAQIIKVILVIVTERRLDLGRFFGAGGMPSSHSSTVCTLSVCIARVMGFTSPEFAIAFVFSVIIMYDAAGVRRAAGQQASVLNKMLDNWHTADNEFTEIELKELLGHTPLQVAVGAVIGILIGYFAVI